MLPIDYERPRTIGEAVSLLREGGAEAQPLAGGTDLVVALRHYKLRPRLIIDLKRVDGFRSPAREEGGTLILPAGTTMSDVIAQKTVLRHFPALAEAARVVGSVQIRNRATLAGNICNASPAADTVPLLALFGASVEIAGPSGRRLVPVREFVQGNRDIALSAGELVSAVRLPIPTGRTVSAFERITRRRGVDLATVNLGCLARADGTVGFALGAVAPRPVLVEGDDLDALMSAATPITDVRAGADYRRAMLGVLARRALARVRATL